LVEAEGHLRRALAQAPHYVTALNCLGAVEAQLGRLDDAATTFQRLTSYNAEDADAWNNLGLVRLRQGRLDDAIDCYQRAVLLKPDFALARANLDQALEQKASSTAPNFLPSAANQERVRACIAQGIALAGQRRFVEAATCFRQALQWQRDSADA